MRRKLYGEYFCGNRASDYAIENGYLDYCTFAESFNHVLNNTLISSELSDSFEIMNGDLFNEYDDPIEIYQYYIVDDYGAEIIQDYTDEILFYSERLDLYLWGVTHFGTSWDYVLTDIKLNCGEEAFVHD